MLTVTLPSSDPVVVPELRIYRDKNRGPVVCIDDNLGKTWACASVPLEIGSVAKLTLPDDSLAFMRIVAPADRAEIRSVLKRVNAPPITFQRGHWYEVHAD